MSTATLCLSAWNNRFVKIRMTARRKAATCARKRGRSSRRGSTCYGRRPEVCAMRHMQLRPATLDDASLLAGIHMQARAAAMPWLPILHSMEETEAWMTNVVLPRQERVDCRRATPQCLRLHRVDHRPGSSSSTLIPSRGGRGVGSVLLEHAKRRQPDGFRLWTFQRNAMARSFYRKHGLIEIRDD